MKDTAYRLGDEVKRFAVTVDGREVDVSVNVTALARGYAERAHTARTRRVRLANGALTITPIVRSTRHATLQPGECAFCDRHRLDPMMPPHDASARCESGKHTHCTCDVCF